MAGDLSLGNTILCLRVRKEGEEMRERDVYFCFVFCYVLDQTAFERMWCL